MDGAKRIYEFGRFRLDGTARLLVRDGKAVPLPPKVVDTLIVLVDNAGNVVDKETLLHSVWPDSFVEENSLSHNISVLRRVLDNGEGQHIETVPKRGYRFVAALRSPEPTVASVTSNFGASPIPMRGRFLRARFLWVAAGLIILMSGVALKLTIPPPIRSVAVLPLQNLSGNPEHDFLADGLTELLISNLAKIGSWRVTSRTSSMRFRNSTKKLPEIAQELKVDAILEGSVMRAGERVRIAVQLVQAKTDLHVWSEVYDREPKDVADLQLDIARTIARQMQIKTTPAEQKRLDRRRTGNPAAFEEYLRGRHAWNKRSPAEIKKAIAHFKNAIDIDAAYAPPYAGLADAYNQLGTHLIGEKPPRETRPLAVAAASRAIEIDGELAEAHAALGFAKMYDWNWSEAEKELRQAIALNPSYGPVRIWYASFLQQQGKHREAIAQAHYALDLDPLSLIVRTQVGWIYAHGNDFATALRYFQDVLEEDPTYLWGQWQLGQTYLYTGKYQEAITVLERAAERSRRTPAILGTLGAAYARAGRKADAEKILQELSDLAKSRYVSAHAFSWVYLGLRDRDRAFEWLEREMEERSNAVAWNGSWHMLDEYRSDPRCVSLMRRIGLADIVYGRRPQSAR